MSTNPQAWTILLVEDQLPNLELVQMLLETRRVKVYTALNGQQALEVLETVTPTAILLDLAMPVMDGWAMMAHMRKDAQLRKIPVIALTAYGISLDDEVERVMKAGFTAYLVKPISPSTIFSEIARVLARAQALNSN